jgi:Ca-activated chloride channel homolog
MNWAAAKPGRMLAGFMAALSLLGLIGVGRASVPSPLQDSDHIRVQTTLVQVPVIVGEQQGAAVQGLKSEDFVLRDDEVVQRIAFFAPSSEPIRIILVLDTSKSTTTVLPAIRQAAADFVSQLRPQDQVMVATFDFEVRVACRFGLDRQEVKRILRDIQVGDYVGSRMYDAVTQLTDKYLRAGQGRKAMILLTDGQDYASKTSADEMIRTMLDSGVVAYPVFYPVDRRQLAKKLFGVSLPKRSSGNAEWEQTEKAAAALLERIAEESAGTLYRSDRPNLKKTFSRITEELRHQYLLAFYPDPARIDGMPHRLRVAVSHPNLVVRFRSNYLAQKSKGDIPMCPFGLYFPETSP